MDKERIKSSLRRVAKAVMRRAGYDTRPIAPGHRIVSRRGERLRALKLAPGATLVAAGEGAGDFATRRLDDSTWVVTRSRTAIQPLGPAAWTVSSQRINQQPLTDRTWLLSTDPALPHPIEVGDRGWLLPRPSRHPQADLALEVQTMRYLTGRHLVWLLRGYRIDTVLDVGANVGQYALELRRNGYQGHIVSFEPVPEFVDKLRALAADDPKWSVHQLALGAEEGVLPIRVQHSLTSALTATEYGRKRFASLEKYADTDQIEVPLRRLDAVLEDLLPPGSDRIFLKLDTQGFDLEAFHGLGDRAKQIVAMQSEVALLLIYEGAPRMAEALAVYEAAGFEITGMFPVTRERDGRVIEYDCMMVRPGEFDVPS